MLSSDILAIISDPCACRSSRRSSPSSQPLPLSKAGGRTLGSQLLLPVDENMRFGAWTMKVKRKRRSLCQKQETCAAIYFHGHFGEDNDLIQRNLSTPLSRRVARPWAEVLFRWTAASPSTDPRPPSALLDTRFNGVLFLVSVSNLMSFSLSLCFTPSVNSFRVHPMTP